MSKESRVLFLLWLLLVVGYLTLFVWSGLAIGLVGLSIYLLYLIRKEMSQRL